MSMLYYETVDRMINKMTQAGRLDLLWLAKDIAGLVLKSKQAKQWITERFDLMLPEILKESWVYKETIEEGRVEGRVEELRNMLVHLTALRFPDLVSQAQKQAEQANSPEQLRTMIDKLVTATTYQEARDALMR